ncbi:sigma-70 family RNA polymerase sigma factor [Ilyomonas limi]|uniref:Sigma-70 family RNA polymerase sigma factor n=1 Tax=Ilyomonas limi TaxID=2575867 RepID=A0A4U3L8R2_9BACT|nr:sigma-70 family RNA polymerase sigma factor [Ilyomonas limi]TKK71735.1 sigma-70 family RNA polymerase sigma factor [Ilyomonas limi]
MLRQYAYEIATTNFCEFFAVNDILLHCLQIKRCFLSADMIAGLKSGDSFIFEELFHTHYEMVYRYVLKKTKCEYIAEETTQLTFIKLWQYRKSLNEAITFETQLFRIVRTTIIDLLKKQQTQSKLAANADNNPVSFTNTVWESVTAQELKGRLMLRMEAMPAVRKKVFQMSRLQDRSNKEIAAELSISVKAVEFHITKALKYLKQILTLLTTLCFHLF